MMHSFLNSHRIVDYNIAHVFADSAEVLTNNGNVLSNQLFNQSGIEFGRHQCHTRYLESYQPPHVISRTISVVVSVKQDRVEPTLKSSTFDTFDQVREKRVGNVRDQQTDHVCSSGSQGARLGIWIIVTLFDCLQ